ncbi:hypothetical protein AVEN_203472-1 [Araneus ventricosus]|uniref:Uncharacterized protein n=1 Tax=Araneus ventricosus TaxID=182803 RepID=A0A4Y2BGZ2_ARAVE|nr:hypothetical protein AVEN_203472-1 [Araneus ventricosus]
MQILKCPHYSGNSLYVGRVYKEDPHFHLEKGLARQRCQKCDFEGFETVPVEPADNEIVSLAKIMGLEVDNNDIDELVKEHSQELTTEELTQLHCVSQQQVVEESLSEEKNITAK